MKFGAQGVCGQSLRQDDLADLARDHFDAGTNASPDQTESVA
ncbi:hypothetical protein [Oceaniovalibus sp. ACAM 378]|nr:hypothetical protein [Oceaniovalibus sp. ACAM 378]